MTTLRGLAALLTLTAAATTASAETYGATQAVEPSDGYVGAGLAVGSQRALQVGMFVDGGKRVFGSNVYEHGQLTGGSSGSDGSYVQMRAGLEARTCLGRNMLCAFGGADIGYQHDQMADQPSDVNGDAPPPTTINAHDAIFVPRVGLELGSRIRVRGGLELPIYQRIDGAEADTSGQGLAGSFAVAGVF